MHVDLGMGIERAERLVHQQDLRLDHQRAHQRRALPHAARQRRRIGFLKTLQSRLRDAGRDARLLLRGGYARKLQAIADIGADRAPRKQRVALKDITDIGRRLAGNHRHAVDQDLAAARPDQRRDHVEDGALARAGRPEQGDEFAAADAERNIAHGLDGRARQLERFAQAPDVDTLHVRRPILRRRGHGLRHQAGYAFRAASMKLGLTTSAMRKRLDAGHFPEPDLFAARETCRVDAWLHSP